MQALQVDEELSPLVSRSFSLESKQNHQTNGNGVQTTDSDANSDQDGEPMNVLVTNYRATTNRMLRVSFNGFLESLGVILHCMRELDEDVVNDDWVGEGDSELYALKRVQGLEEMGAL